MRPWDMEDLTADEMVALQQDAERVKQAADAFEVPR